MQTGFQQGMEKLLGVDQEIKTRQEWGRRDVHEADILEQDENRDAVRQRYQRLYWESIPESRGVSNLISSRHIDLKLNSRSPLFPESLSLRNNKLKKLPIARKALAIIECLGSRTQSTSRRLKRKYKSSPKMVVLRLYSMTLEANLLTARSICVAQLSHSGGQE